jgi:hypothetical protein
LNPTIANLVYVHETTSGRLQTRGSTMITLFQTAITLIISVVLLAIPLVGIRFLAAKN